ncbi:MAG TPA: flagellar basal-body rod protein FlgF [Candidatus Hydrogenedentes bacterium]|nr:flagellar basal-body rod protein FlgF [Candidatus Hydrogenedentota bacterium]
MIQGLYAAANGMMAVEARQDAIANNIANASTVGFKSVAPVELGFYQTLSQKLQKPFHYDINPAPAGGVKVVETYTNLAAGVVRQSDNPLHIALQGPGYFAVDTAKGERYTRAGDFTCDEQGRLCSSEGYAVQSTSGQPIDVRGGQVNVDREGRVTVDGVEAGIIRVVEFENPERLLREGNNLYAASEEVIQKSAEAANTTVQQNYLEMSNVDLPHEMIVMMLGLRAYEANQRAIEAMDSTMGRLIDQVGMPA